MNIGCMHYLQAKGLLSATRNRMLDIGPQNVYFCTEDDIRRLVHDQGATPDKEWLSKEATRLAYFSTPRPEERTTLFSEIADLAGIDYHAIDVCPAFKTIILDMNFERLPSDWQDSFDVVLNFGTTEHIFNQWNSFEIIHDATKVDGTIYHVLPASGYLEHGYFCYTPLFFKELAASNDYEVADMFLAPAGENRILELGFDVRTDKTFSDPHSARLPAGEDRVPNFNIHVILRKTKSAPFKCGLEIATAHSAVNEIVAARYGIGDRDILVTDERVRIIHQLTRDVDELHGNLASARAESESARHQLEAVKRSTSWRVGKAIVQPFRILKGRNRGA